MKENLHLRCCNCKGEFTKTLETRDKVYEVVCPFCHKESVELDLGKNRFTGEQKEYNV